MASENGNNAVEVHWSRDYVEHLRTSHFALVLASAALIGLVLTAKPYSAAKALTELQQILQLKARWGGDWVRETVLSSPPALVMEPRSVQMAKGEVASRITVAFSNLLYVNVPAIGVVTSNPKFMEVRLIGTWTLDPFSQASSEFSGEFPGRNLRGMKSWWERLANPRLAAVVERLLPECLVSDYSNEDPDLISCSVRTSKGHIITDALTPVTNKLTASLYLQGIHQKGSGTQYYDGQDGYWFSGRDGNYSVRIYASYYVVSIDQGFVAKALGEGVNAGSFETSFSDLMKASAGLEALPLEKLETRLSDELAKGPDTLEAFGLKIPAELASNGGTLLLICAQLYLIAYLRQLSGHLKNDDDGWNVPWIALEGSWLGQSMYMTSLAVTPLAIELLRWHALHPPTGSHPNWLGYILFVAPLLLSLVLAMACWFYRPLKNQKPSSAQLQKTHSAAN